MAKRIASVMTDPFVPKVKKNQKGMQAGDVLDEAADAEATKVWLEARNDAARHAARLAELGVHKQWANRLIEPYCWVTDIISATQWDNFFALRTHEDAQDEFRTIARMMYLAYRKSEPTLLQPGQWHLPFIQDRDREAVYCRVDGDVNGEEYLRLLRLISAGRSARLSYETHDGRRDLDEDIALALRLRDNKPMHASPLEHQGTPSADRKLWGNYVGWAQHRKLYQNECVRHFEPSDEEIASWGS